MLSERFLSDRLSLGAACTALLSLTLGACSGAPTRTLDDCYPAGAAEPMQEGEVITAYQWERARDADDEVVSLDLQAAACDTDDNIDWSPFDLLLFVSIPAW